MLSKGQYSSDSVPLEIKKKRQRLINFSLAQLQMKEEMGYYSRAYLKNLYYRYHGGGTIHGGWVPVFPWGSTYAHRLYAPFILLCVAGACHLRVHGGCKWEATKKIALCHEGSLRTFFFFFFPRGVEKWQGQGWPLTLRTVRWSLARTH